MDTLSSLMSLDINTIIAKANEMNISISPTMTKEDIVRRILGLEFIESISHDTLVKTNILSYITDIPYSSNILGISNDDIISMILLEDSSFNLLNEINRHIYISDIIDQSKKNGAYGGFIRLFKEHGGYTGIYIWPCEEDISSYDSRSLSDSIDLQHILDRAADIQKVMDVIYNPMIMMHDNKFNYENNRIINPSIYPQKYSNINDAISYIGMDLSSFLLSILMNKRMRNSISTAAHSIYAWFLSFDHRYTTSISIYSSTEYPESYISILNVADITDIPKLSLPGIYSDSEEDDNEVTYTVITIIIDHKVHNTSILKEVAYLLWNGIFLGGHI